MCHLEETKSHWSLLYGVYAGEVKEDMSNLSWKNSKAVLSKQIEKMCQILLCTCIHSVSIYIIVSINLLSSVITSSFQISYLLLLSSIPVVWGEAGTDTGHRFLFPLHR